MKSTICTLAVVLLSAGGLAWAGAPAAPPPAAPLPAEPPAVVPPTVVPAVPATHPPAAGRSKAVADVPLEVEEPARPFVPAHPRTEAEQDHLNALALYAAGRMAEQRQEYASALRQYERAHRYDPSGTFVLREIVPLAFNLDHPAEAVRYALMLVDRERTDPMMLRRLAAYVNEEGDAERALKLYEKAAAMQAGEKPSVATVTLWLEMGRLYYLTEKSDQAAREFAKVVLALEKPDDYGLDPAARKTLLHNADATYQLLGEAFLEANRPADAAAAFEKSNQFKADEATFAFNLARVEQKQKNTERALDKLQVYFDKHGTARGTNAYELLAELLKESGHADQLVDRMEKMHAGDPDNAALSYFLAEQYRQVKKFDKAVPLYLSALENPSKKGALDACRVLVQIDREQHNYEGLVKVLGQAVDVGGTLDSLGDAGKAFLADGEAVKGALDSAREHKEADDAAGASGRRLAMALVALANKQLDLAREFFDQAIRAAPQKEAELLLAGGLELLVAQQYGEAAKLFERGVQKVDQPTQAAVFRFYLAGALEMIGKTDEALAAARQAADGQKDSPRFAARAAWILTHAKRTAEAKKAYEALLESFDSTHDSPEVREVMHEARLALSNLHVTAGNLPAGEEWLEQVLDEFPDDAGALNDLGFVWADNGKHLQRSLDMIRKAVAAEPDNKAYRDSLGWVLYRLAQYPEAVVELRKAADVSQPDAVILDHLGDALLKTNDVPGAIDAWSRAASAFEKDAEAEKVKQTREKIAAAQSKAAHDSK